jgi:HK97 family phage prohead protease
MLWGAASGALELRAENGGVRVSGRFPYGVPSELAPGRREVVAAEAFTWDGEAVFLYGHDMAKPLASVRAGSLELRQTAEALELSARIDGGTSWAADFAAAHRAGLVTGLSPGFRVAAGGERVERSADGLLRTITAAELVEVSAVTRPAYPAAQIEARSWAADQVANFSTRHPLARWRL